MTKLVKIDRIKSPSEAHELETLGVDFVSVSLDKDPRYDDDRSVSMDAAASIKQYLKRTRYVGELDFGEQSARSLEVATAIGFDYVQPMAGGIPPLEVRRTLKRNRVGIIYSNIEVSHDDDPSWILSRYGELEELNAAFFQIDLLPEYSNSWNFMRADSPRYEDEIQIEDINQLGAVNDLLIVLDYSPENVGDILTSLPNIKGISIVLGSRPLRNDVHYADYSVALSVLDVLRS